METNFNNRFGIKTRTIGENNFPPESRNSLMFILKSLVDKQVIGGERTSKPAWTLLANELSRIRKVGFSEATVAKYDSAAFNDLLLTAEWNEVFIFIERVYNRLLQDAIEYGYNDSIQVVISREEAQKELVKEISNLLQEDGFPYQFTDGIFHRHGRIQTLKNISRAMAILDDPRLRLVRQHFTKAITFFSSRENPDFPNAVKDSLCAVEVAAEILSGRNVSKDFNEEMKKLEGKGEGQIPPPLVQSIIKIFAYRGKGVGVAHGNSEGFRVGKAEAELVLSVSAAFITYFYEIFDVATEDNLF